MSSFKKLQKTRKIRVYKEGVPISFELKPGIQLVKMNTLVKMLEEKNLILRITPTEVSLLKISDKISKYKYLWKQLIKEKT